MNPWYSLEVSGMQTMSQKKTQTICRLYFYLLLGLLLLSGCKKGEGGPPLSQTHGPQIPEIGFIVVEERPVELTTELPGRISASRMAEIRPQVNGIIQKRLFEEGSDVKAGQLLYQIDPASFEAVYASAKASLERAKANLPSVQSRASRYKDLIRNNAVSKQDYDDAAAALAQTKADIDFWNSEVEKARINLDYTRINAPISGRIDRSNVTEGAIVTAYQPMPLAAIVQLDPIYVDVTQSSSEFLRLRRSLDAGKITDGQENRRSVRIILEDGSNYSLEGELRSRDVMVNPATGSTVLRIVAPNPNRVLLPGMFVRAIVREGVAAKAILVPQQGVSRNSKGQAVALVVDEKGLASLRVLVIDRAIGNQWLVMSGLVQGDRLIVEGLLKVRPGAPVKAVQINLDQPETNAPSVPSK